MSQTGFTPIQLYYSTTASTAPTAGNLANGELAINITDGKLFYKDNGGVVQVLATKGAGTIGGSTTQVQYNNAGALAGSANLTFDGTTLTAAGLAGPHNGTVGATTANTGAFTTLSASGAVTLSGGTANGVAYLNGSKVLTTGSALTFNGTKLQIGSFGSSGRLLETYGSEALFDGAGQFDLLIGDGGVAYMSLTTNDNATALKIRNYSGSSDIAVFERATGNVGIGTSSPGTALHVQRSSANAVLRLSSSVGSGRDWNINSQTDGYLTIGSDLLAGQLNLYQGNLGIGITAAARRLEVSGAGSGETYQLRLGAGNSNISFTYDIGRSTVDGLFRFYGNQTGFTGYIFGGVDGERARIDSSGNLLRGQTSSGNANSRGFYSDTAGYFGQNHLNGDASGSVYAYFGYNGSSIGTITQNGTTGVLYNLTSDYRLKNNPEALTGSGEFIDALQPKKWQWWDGSGEGVGFIAHEFMEVAKYSGNGEKDAVDADGNPVYQSIQPSSSEVMANLVAEIQSLRKRLAAAGI